jgi:hypothetical protein
MFTDVNGIFLLNVSMAHYSKPVRSISAFYTNFFTFLILLLQLDFYGLWILLLQLYFYGRLKFVQLDKDCL